MSGTNDLAASSERGPLCWRNWLAPLPDEVRSFEATLYTDAWLTGGPLLSFGPYEIYNTVPAVEGEMREGLVLRVRDHVAPRVHSPESLQTDTSSWIGLTLDEEIAALLALTLGARVRSGGITRTFDSDDPRGRPVAYGHRPPQWNPPRMTILPHLYRATVSLDETHIIHNLPRLTANDAIALIRAARSYQNALWVADEDPDSAWIRLTSAVEVVAAADGSADSSPEDALAEWKPDLAQMLKSRGGPSLVTDTASHLSHLIGSSQKFLRFMMKFDPGPPASRPDEEWARVNWKSLRARLRSIYDYRSQSLHGGSPFPGPLCVPPMRTVGPAWSERPLGLASFSESTQWHARDLPMYLWVYERTVRGALLNWWTTRSASIGEPQNPSSHT